MRYSVWQAQVLEFPRDYDRFLDVLRSLPRWRLGRGALPTNQGPPDAFRQGIGQLLHVGLGVEAKEETHARVRVPAVQMLGLGEVGIAAQQHALEPGAQAEPQ